MSHADAYFTAPHLPAPSCPRLLIRVGRIFEPGVPKGLMLYQCPGCRRLVAVGGGRVRWEIPIPAVAIGVPDALRVLFPGDEEPSEEVDSAG